MVEEVWVEKYRPKKIEEIVGQEEVTKRLSTYVEAGNMPNMLFAGPPGIGKTTAALALAMELFGEGWEANFLELNASDERGIDVVRGKIKEFARTKALRGGFKIIFLDEADALTKDAQNAMRRSMERYSSVCRFILSCNYSSKIIEPIQSRCALFRFRQLREDAIRDRLSYISGKEGLTITDDAMELLLLSSEGDLRRAINMLQSSSAIKKEIDAEVVSAATSVVMPGEIRRLIELAMKGEFMESRKLLRELIMGYGVAGEDLIAQIHREVFRLSVPDEMKIHLAGVIGEYEFRIVEGSNEIIQLEAMLAQFALKGGK
ncbi:MAG: replication factor C small subunit [Methanobacteriota archaeon]|nr:MAG: replication factor C small subunit [Euryarchaeota archaeon]